MKNNHNLRLIILKISFKYVILSRKLRIFAVVKAE